MFFGNLLGLLELVGGLDFVLDGCAVALEGDDFVPVAGSFDLVHDGVPEAGGEGVEDGVLWEIYDLGGPAHHDFDVEQEAFEVGVKILVEVALVVVDGVDSAVFLAQFLLELEEDDEDIEDGLHGVLELELLPVLHVVDGFFFGLEAQLAQVLLQNVSQKLGLEFIVDGLEGFELVALEAAEDNQNALLKYCIQLFLLVSVVKALDRNHVWLVVENVVQGAEVLEEGQVQQGLLVGFHRNLSHFEDEVQQEERHLGYFGGEEEEYIADLLGCDLDEIEVFELVFLVPDKGLAVDVVVLAEELQKLEGSLVGPDAGVFVDLLVGGFGFEDILPPDVLGAYLIEIVVVDGGD